MKKLIFLIISVCILSCYSDNQNVAPNPMKVEDLYHHNDFFPQVNSYFTESQMLLSYIKSLSQPKKEDYDSTGHFEFFKFIENNEDYKAFFGCPDIKTPLPIIDFSKEMIVIGMNDKTRNAIGVKQYLELNENNVLTITVVTKGKHGGGEFNGFVTKVNKKGISSVIVKFAYIFTD
jgi:hypothetical protein